MMMSLGTPLIVFCLVGFTHSQIDENRRQRNPFEFYQIGAENPPRLHHSLHYLDNSESVPRVGTSDFVRYFARQTSGQNLNNLKYITERESTVLRNVPLIDINETDRHSNHRNFVRAGANRFYAVSSPPLLEAEAPIVGHYFSSYQGRNKGKLYLGNRPFYF